MQLAFYALVIAVICYSYTQGFISSLIIILYNHYKASMKVKILYKLNYNNHHNEK